MKEKLFNLLFSDEVRGDQKIKHLEKLLCNKSNKISLNCSSVSFFESYMQRVLDEFPFIKNLKWCKWDEMFEMYDPFDLFFSITIGDANLLFKLDVDRIMSPMKVDDIYYHWLHPKIYNPKEIISKLRWQYEKGAISSSNFNHLIDNSNEWLRFMDGFILFNDLEFFFLDKNESEPDLSSFLFKEAKGEYGYWVFNDGAIEEDLDTPYIEFELIRKENSFLCISKEYIPDAPLAMK